jgi:hypothetical protein
MGIVDFDYDLSNNYLNFSAGVALETLTNFTIKFTTFKDTDLLGPVRVSYLIVDPSFSINNRVHLVSLGIVYSLFIFSLN